MRSKRMLTILLAICLVVSLVAPSVTAVSVDKGTGTGSSEQTGTSGSGSTHKNDLLLDSNGKVPNGIETLRDPSSSDSNKGYESTGGGDWTVTPSDTNVSTPLLNTQLPDSVKELREAAEIYEASDIVAAFVVMEEKPLAETYSSILDVPQKQEDKLVQAQAAVISRIEKDVLEGETLQVEEQFTYLTNAISITTEFGNLEKIAALPGVKTVFLMPVYQPCETEKVASPFTVSAGGMSGVPTVWESLKFTGTGMTIAVIDTGLDLDHPSFVADPATNENSMTMADVQAVLGDLNASMLMPGVTAEQLYRSAKVPFAFNYVDESLVADHSRDQMGDHGTHVSGIAAANPVEGSGVVGMAPDAQIVVLKVFGANGGAYLDDILAALEDAMTLECDVANLSLGSPAGFSSVDPEIDAIYERIAETDIIVDIAAGNEGTSSYSNMWGTDLNPTEHIDNATISSPATYANAMAVASIDNLFVMGPYFMLDQYNIGYNDGMGLYVTFASLAGEALEYVMVPGLGEVSDFEGLDVEGKIAVVARGTISFAEKLANAEAAGAIGLIVTNNEPGSISSFGMSMEDENGELAEGVSGYVPAVLISMEAGQLLAAAEEKTIQVSAEDGLLPDEFGGQVSSFSSWGVAPDLRLLPDIAGVGGNVYSCYDGGQYGLMSGTSMASPQVAGVTALVLQYLKETFPTATEDEIRVLLDSLLMSTAVPASSSDSGLEASPRQQGSGLANALYAVTSEAYLTVAGSGRPKAELFDSVNGTYSFTFTVHNFSNEDKTYTLSSSLLTEDYVEIDGKDYMAGYEHALDNAAVSFSSGTVTVAAGGTADVTVTITLTAEDKNWIDAHFANGNYVEGFVYLTNADEEGVDLSLPFLGFYGDWTDAPLFDTAFWYGNSVWGDASEIEGSEYWHILWTSLGMSEADWMLGMNPYSGPVLDDDGNVIYNAANNTISNNGDGVIDNLSEIYLSLMRNARNVTFTYTDAKGDAVFAQTADYVSKTMYISAYGSVVPYIHSWYLPAYDFTDANGDPLPSGTKLTLKITGELDYQDGGDFSLPDIPITVDTQVPTIVEGSVEEFSEGGRNYLRLTVSDNSLAAVYLFNPSGTRILDQRFDEQDFTRNADGTYTVTVDVTGQGNDLLLTLCDYGANEGNYALTYQAENDPVVDTDALYAYRVHDADIELYYGYDYQFGWVTIGKDDAAITELTNDYMEYYALNAAEYAGGYVFAVDAGYNFVVMEPGLWNRKTVCNIGLSAMDMAFDQTTNTMYLSAKGEDEWGYETYGLYTLDLLTGETTLLYDYGSKYDLPYAMTVVNGTIYAVKYYNSGFYTVDPETYELVAVTDAEGNNIQLKTSAGRNISPYYSQSMTYSETDGKIYWAYYSYSGMPDLFVIDPTDCSYTAIPFATDSEYVGLLTLEDGGYQLPEAEALSGLLMSEESTILVEGQQLQLTASPLPWNYEAGAITWASGDESIAVVDQDGVITAVSEGVVAITATCEGITATCEVTVVNVEGNLYAYNYFNGTGDYGDWISIDLESGSYESMYLSPIDFLVADYNGHDGCVYGYDMYGQFYRFDTVSGECVALGAPLATSDIPMDMAYDYSTGLMYAVTADQMAWTSTLCYVNMNNGSLVDVATAYDVYMTLACSTEGELYAISVEGVLYNLFVYEDTWYGSGMMIEPVYIMEGLGILQYAQSMCYDHNNDVLLWAYAEGSNVYWIDPFAAEPYALPLGDPTGSGLLEFVGLYTVPAVIEDLPYIPVESVTAEDMLLMTGGSKIASVTVAPLNATNQTITYVSADESVATVDEFGMITGVAEGVTTVTGTLVDGENTYEFTFTVNVKTSAGYLNGFVVSDVLYGPLNAWAQFSDQDPTNDIGYVGGYYLLYAEEYLDGKLYAYGYDEMDWEANFQFMVINAETYEIESMTDMGSGFPFVYDMTYDYSTGTMYAVAGYNDSSSDLYAVNMENGKLVPVMQTEPFIMSLAASPDGNLYGISASQEEYDPMTWSSVYTNSVLYKFNVAEGTYEEVFDTGVQCNRLASMAFDFDTGNLYWSALFQASYWDPASGGLYMIDLAEQAAYNLGNIGPAGSQVTGLYIVADEYPEVPEELYNITLTSSTEELNVGESVQLESFVQPYGCDAELIWTSADESVATVDENGNVTAVAPGVTTVTVTVVEGDKTFTATCAIIVFAENDRFLSYNMTDGGFAAISRNDLTQVTNLTEGEEVDVRSMALVDGVIYGYDVNNTFFSTTEESGFVRTEIGTAEVELPEDDEANDYYFEVRDLTWDGERLLALVCKSVTVTEDWYGSVYVESYELVDGCEIYEVDLSTGALTYLTTVSSEYGSISNVYTMTAAPDGSVYIYSSFDDYVSTVDVETGMITQITTLQNQGVYGGSDGEPMAMAYDPITCNIYLLFTTNGNLYQMVSYNTSDHSLTVLGKIGVAEGYYGDAFAGLIIDAEHTHAWGAGTVVTEADCENACVMSRQCLLCGETETYTEGEALGHSLGEWVVTTEPTCTEDGVETKFCANCAYTETRAVPATGHSYVSVVTAPTTEEEGYTTHTCENCGHSYKDTYTDKLPVEDPGNAGTGDTFQTGLLAVLMTVCAMGLGVLVINRKKFGWK